MEKKVIELDFGTLTIDHNLVVGVMDEGITLDHEKFSIVSRILTRHFKDRPYGYISHRVYSYAIDPTVYMHIKNKRILRALAIVTEAPVMLSNAEIEKQFITQPLKVFRCIDNAKKWIYTQL